MSQDTDIWYLGRRMWSLNPNLASDIRKNDFVKVLFHELTEVKKLAYVVSLLLVISSEMID